MTECTAWLQDFLADGWKPCEVVREAAYEAGFSKRDLQIARAELGVIPDSITTWRLPEDKA